MMGVCFGCQCVAELEQGGELTPAMARALMLIRAAHAEFHGRPYPRVRSVPDVPAALVAEFRHSIGADRRPTESREGLVGVFAATWRDGEAVITEMEAAR